MMAGVPDNKQQTPSKDETQQEILAPDSSRQFDWKMGMIVIIGVLLLFTFLDTFITNPTISGYSVAGAESQDTGRLSSMTALLFIIFAFFGLFIFIVSRKLKEMD